MRYSKLFLILAAIIALGNFANAANYYPELGMDPMYSSLNATSMYRQVNENIEDDDEPYYENNEDYDTFSFKDLFKRKNKKVKKLIDEGILPEESVEEASDADNSTEKREVFVRPKKNSDYAKMLEKEEREKEKALQKEQESASEKVSIWQKLKFWDKSSKQAKSETVEQEPDIELTADFMEYYPERYEVEAVGNARVNFKKYDVVLSASKIIFNYDRNVIKAKDDVVLMSRDSITEGDFIKLDLSKPEGFIENPVTSAEDIKLKAKEARVYSNKIEEYDGVAKIMKNEVLRFGATSFSNYVDKGHVFHQGTYNRRKLEHGVYSLKARDIYIDAKDDHDVITVKNADLMLKNKRIAVIPSAKIVTNKEHSYIETNMPEVGAIGMLGSYIGPAVVLNVPGGSTLKLAPIVTYSKSKFGIGGIARFRNEYNMTEVAYGTSREELLVRGRHKLAPGLTLNYSRLTPQNEWFFGYRRPKYSAQLNYARTDYVDDLKLHFSQMYSAGAFVDHRKGQDFRDAEGRFRWMTQTYKPLYEYMNDEGNVGFNVGLVAQTAATVYTTGDVHGIFRFGPALNTKVGPWQQSLSYYQSAIAGQSPFEFDRYRYGRSNLVIVESLRVCKYLSLGYLASVAMNRDVPSDRAFQENRFLVSIGPDYAKFTIGYDSVRHNTMVLLSMLVGTQDSDIEFKRATIGNVSALGDKNTKKKPKKKNYKKYLKEAPVLPDAKNKPEQEV